MIFFHHPSGSIYHLYTPLIVLANWMIICYRSHLWREPGTSIQTMFSPWQFGFSNCWSGWSRWCDTISSGKTAMKMYDVMHNLEEHPKATGEKILTTPNKCMMFFVFRGNHSNFNYNLLILFDPSQMGMCSSALRLPPEKWGRNLDKMLTKAVFPSWGGIFFFSPHKTLDIQTPPEKVFGPQ